MQHNDWDHIAVYVMVMAFRLVVDEITRVYGPGDPTQTTVRGLHGARDKNAIPRPVTLAYAFYQICATAAALIPRNPRYMDLGFNALIAVQSSAFLMTLFRKGLIRWYSHALWYSVAIVMGWVVLYHQLPLYMWVKFAVCFHLRCNLSMGKYKMWALYAFFSLPTVENAIFAELDAYRSTMQTPDFAYFAKPVSF